MKKLLPFFPPLILLTVICIFFRSFFLQGNIPLPADTLIGLYHPYRDLYADTNPNGIAYKNFLITDPIRQQYPWRYIAIQDSKASQFPIWNPYSGLGEPLFANIQSAVVYPLNAILFIMPFHKGWSVLILLQLVLGGLFMYAYLRYHRLSEAATFLGSVSYVFSGFFTAWLTWNTLAHVALWLPLALLSVDHIVTEKKGKQVLLWSFVLIFAMTVSFLAGHLQTYFYISLLVAAYVLFRTIALQKKTVPLAIFIGVLANIFVLISVQFFSTIQLILQSARDTDQLLLTDKEGWFIPFQHLIQFIAPDFFGNPATLNYFGTWNYGEMVGYIGFVPLFFACYSLLGKRKKTVIFFTAVVIISLLFALPTFLARLPFLLHIPLLSTSQPTRLMVLIDFSLCVLSAYGFDAFLMSPKLTKKLTSVLSVFVIVIASLWLYVSFYKGIPPEQYVNLAIAKRNLILPTVLLITLTGFIGAMLFFKNYMIRTIVLCLLLGIVCVDLLRFSSKFNPFVNPSYIFPTTKTISYLQRKTMTYPWRFLGVDIGNQKRVLPPNVASYYKLYTIDTYNPLLLKNLQNYAAASEFNIAEADSVSFNRIVALNNYDSRLIDLAGIKYIVSLSDIKKPTYKLRIKEGQTRVYENTAVYPRAFMIYDYVIATSNVQAASQLLNKDLNLRTTAVLFKKPTFDAVKEKIKNSVRITSYTENSVVLSVKNDREGMLLVTDTFYPTWRATVDGKSTEVFRADLAFRGVVVPKGNHEVVLKTNIF